MEAKGGRENVNGINEQGNTGTRHGQGRQTRMQIEDKCEQVCLKCEIGIEFNASNSSDK